MNYDLEKDMKYGLEQLKNKSIHLGKPLVKHKSTPGFFIGDAYKNNNLDPDVVSILATVIRFTKKYQISPPTTILELIQASRTINNLINRLRDFQKTHLIFHTPYVVAYIDTLEFELSSAASQASESQPSRKRSSEISPIHLCALCWKRTFSSNYYCKDHHPKRNLANHKKAKNQLFTAIKLGCDNNVTLLQYQEYKEGKLKDGPLASKLFSWTKSFAISLSVPISPPVIPSSIIDSTIKTIKKGYPKTIQKLGSQLENKSMLNLRLWVLQIIRALDPTEAIIWEHKESELWLGSSPEMIVNTLLATIRRHEAFLLIQEVKPTYGPRKGTNANQKLRTEIKKRLAQQKKEKGKTNLSEIARELKLSRQRISVLSKDL